MLLMSKLSGAHVQPPQDQKEALHGLGYGIRCRRNARVGGTSESKAVGTRKELQQARDTSHTHG